MSHRLFSLIAGLAVLAMASTTQAKDVVVDFDIIVDVEVGEPIMLADKAQHAYIKIGLTGFDLKNKKLRAPVNLALVLDRSASMSGDKLEKAKEAALMVVNRLRDDDIISIVSYDSTVEVLVPATKVQEREYIRQRIRGLTSRGSTALFAGVSRGIEEVRKFLGPNRVNRVILLSDGQANIGPSSPNELGRLGAAAAKAGISISTIGVGLGYNEDLMTQIARRSDGNHAFAQTAQELVKIFNYELGDVLSVVAQNVVIEIELGPGIRPIRSLNRDATIHGRKVRLSLNQLYAKQEKFFLLEVAVPATKANAKLDLATVDVRYANVITKKKRRVRDRATVVFSASRKAVSKRQNREVLIAAVEAIGTLRNRHAVELRDKGQINEARLVLNTNSVYLHQQGLKLRSKKLQKDGKDNKIDADNLEGPEWNRQRKVMRENQYKNASQRGW